MFQLPKCKISSSVTPSLRQQFVQVLCFYRVREVRLLVPTFLHGGW